MAEKPRKPPVPAGLGPAGRKLWRDVMAEFGVENHNLPTLKLACIVLDRCESITEALVNQPLTVINSKGDETQHPLLIEHRQQAIVYGRLLNALRLPDATGAAPQHRGGFRGSYLTAVED